MSSKDSNISIFVGNISRNVETSDLLDEFEKYGPCHINHRGTYAFVEYQEARDAEDAMAHSQNKDMGGLQINIEWSKKSGKFDEAKSRRPPKRKNDLKCYNCGKTGHFARDCNYHRHHSHSRSRSRSHDKGRKYFKSTAVPHHQADQDPILTIKITEQRKAKIERMEKIKRTVARTGRTAKTIQRKNPKKSP